jgi:hypothetical protein
MESALAAAMRKLSAVIQHPKKWDRVDLPRFVRYESHLKPMTLTGEGAIVRIRAHNDGAFRIRKTLANGFRS